ncbi:diguanylate cyclase (GGDEF) domain-containing protein [Pseudoxanthomonas sp. GM95]|uniref:GGDEF domain-containing protein n=1 Tax=Pseudoxanthomonas sp. GM95 TaxID=1881043 RepID=UPI0008CB3C70|nr:GGDEF domain-containing protein [Pseudoxanthomonas sp. GM95]SEL61965.1 diguanylate cyclase (GGDEF) domain-containing protein [Pseudoxanthomonas sp. GM95]
MTTLDQTPRRLLPNMLRGFVLAVCLIFAGVEYWHGLETRAEARTQIQLDASNLARSVGQHAEDSFQLADSTLAGIVESLHDYGTGPRNLALLNAFLRQEAARSTRIHGLFVYDAQGKWIATSLPNVPANMNNSDRAYFIHHREVDDALSWMGPPVRSRTDNTWIITITRRFNDAEGKFGGVVLASIRSDYFADFYRGYDVGKQGAIALINAQGVVCARLPDDNGNVGRDLSKTPLFASMQGKVSGSLTYVSPVDQVRRISGFHHAEHFPLIAVAALSEHEALGAWQRSVRTHALLTLVTIGLFAGLGEWLRRQLLERQVVQDQLEALARTDGLTGLANRRALDEYLADSWPRAVRESTPLGLLLVDIDHFKAFNDTYGHQAGDACLRQVAAAVKRCARRHGDLAARYGGEELALVLPGCDSDALRVLAEAVCRSVRELGVPHAESYTAPVVTISVGAASVWPGRLGADAGPASLVELADLALYDAKAGGRNRAAVRT